MSLKVVLAFFAAIAVEVSATEEIQTIYEKKATTFLKKIKRHAKKHHHEERPVEVLVQQEPVETVKEDEGSNSVTFEVEEVNPDYTSHQQHIESNEEFDSSKASGMKDHDNVANNFGDDGTVNQGVDEDVATEHEAPTRTDMQVLNAHHLLQAQKMGQLDPSIPVVHVEVQEQPQMQQPQVSLAHTGSTHRSHLEKSMTTVGARSGSGAPGTRPKGWDQCLKFARMIKAQGVTGVELIRVWKTTCEPAVESGMATERYKLMCNSLGGAVEPFAAQHDYDVMQLCDSVMTVFHDVLAQ